MTPRLLAPLRAPPDARRPGARVLILDEPTAALDVRAEAALYERFLELTAGLTTIVISHRFSTVRRADRIVVLDGGRVVEDGTHDALVAAGGRYATMFALQAQRFAGDAPDTPEHPGPGHPGGRPAPADPDGGEPGVAEGGRQVSAGERGRRHPAPSARRRRRATALREAWRGFRVLMSFSFTAAPREATLFLLCACVMALGGPAGALGAKLLVDAVQQSRPPGGAAGRRAALPGRRRDADQHPLLPGLPVRRGGEGGARGQPAPDAPHRGRPRPGAPRAAGVPQGAGHPARPARGPGLDDQRHRRPGAGDGGARRVRGPARHAAPGPAPAPPLRLRLLLGGAEGAGPAARRRGGHGGGRAPPAAPLRAGHLGRGGQGAAGLRPAGGADRAPPRERRGGHPPARPGGLAGRRAVPAGGPAVPDRVPGRHRPRALAGPPGPGHGGGRGAHRRPRRRDGWRGQHRRRLRHHRSCSTCGWRSATSGWPTTPPGSSGPWPAAHGRAGPGVAPAAPRPRHRAARRHLPLPRHRRPAGPAPSAPGGPSSTASRSTCRRGAWWPWWGRTGPGRPPW